MLKSYCQIWCLRFFGHAAIWSFCVASIPSLNLTPVMTLAKGFEGLIKGMLAGIGVEPPEDIGGSVFLELDGGDKPQQVIPIFSD